MKKRAEIINRRRFLIKKLCKSIRMTIDPDIERHLLIMTYHLKTDEDVTNTVRMALEFGPDRPGKFRDEDLKEFRKKYRDKHYSTRKKTRSTLTIKSARRPRLKKVRPRSFIDEVINDNEYPATLQLEAMRLKNKLTGR